MYNPVLTAMKERFDLEITASHELEHFQTADISNIVSNLDSLALTSLFKIAQITRSVCIGLTLLHEDITIPQALDTAFVEVDYQTKHYGKTHIHELERVRAEVQISGAKSLINI